MAFRADIRNKYFLFFFRKWFLTHFTVSLFGRPLNSNETSNNFNNSNYPFLLSLTLEATFYE